MNKDTFCIAPWTHLHIDTVGTVLPCCMARPTQTTNKFQNLKVQSTAAAWNSPRMQELRRNMIGGVQDTACDICYRRESSPEGWSYRRDFNQKYERFMDTAVSADGSATFNPVSYDIRFDNNCNLRCRMCSTWSSTKWIKDGVAMVTKFNNRDFIHPSQQGFQSQSIVDFDKFIAEIDHCIASAEEFYFAGGEPLMSENHYKLLQELIHRNMTHVPLRYNTNLTTLRFHDYSALELWSQFRNIHLAVSIDEIGERNDYIRKDSKWDKLVQNITTVQQQPNIELWVTVTVQILNVCRLEEIASSLIDFGIKQQHIFFNVLFTPEYFSIQNLPTGLKQHLTTKYANVATKFPLIAARFADVISVMNDVPASPSALDNFFMVTAQLDELRTESLSNTFPDLVEALNEHK